MFDPNGKGHQLISSNTIEGRKIIKYVDEFILDNIIRPWPVDSDKDKKKEIKEEYLKKLQKQRNPGFTGYKQMAPVGMPITMENKDMTKILSTNEREEFKYSLTQKVDGTRMLMFIGGNPEKLPDILNKDLSDRLVVFIDREWNYYSAYNQTQSTLPTIKIGKPSMPEMLLDGEMVFFDSSGNSYKELSIREVKGVSFMTFDILFGPNEIGIEKNQESSIVLKLGQSSSMVIPLDGIPRTNPWPYLNRYDILYKLIIPKKELNNDRAIISEAFKNIDWFNVEIKPIHSLGEIKRNKWKNVYLTHDPDKPLTAGKSQKVLREIRNGFYERLSKEPYNKSGTGNFVKKALNLDGLIFTDASTLYTIGTWNSPTSPQFKWKPSGEQTIDFSIKKPKGSAWKQKRLAEPTEVLLEIRATKFAPPKELGLENIFATSVMSTEDYSLVKDGDIGEFIVSIKDKTLLYTFQGFRRDKKVSNVYQTAKNVLNSVVNPVDINKLITYLTIDYESGGKMNIAKKKQLLGTLDRETLIKCATMSEGGTFIKKEDLDKILTSITKYSQNPEIELEFRIGKIEKYFNANLSFENGTNAIKIMDTKNWKKEINEYVDLVGEGIDKGFRARWLKLGRFNRYVLNDGAVVNKQRISDLGIELEMFPFDIRFSISSETPVKMPISKYKTIKKNRTTYTHPSGKFVIDITEVIFGGNLENRKYSPPNDKKESIWQIEAELLIKDSTVLTEMVVIIQYLIDNI
jgi:hypothetical protein